MADRTPNSPNTLAYVISASILAGITGYLLGVFSSLGFLPIPFLPNNGPNYKTHDHPDTDEESEAEDIDEDILDHAPNWGNALAQDEKDGLRFRKGKENVAVKGGEKKVQAVMGSAAAATTNEECKLVLVVRTDLGMTKGMSLSACTSS